MHADVVIIGAGQAGLAMSRCLAERSVDHVVLERGDVANAWRTQRWDSLRLLTPNWLSRLPGWQYSGDDPHGYMTAAQVAEYLQGYRQSFDAPVVANTTVLSVRSAPRRFVIETTSGQWTAQAVVVATGAAGTARVPDMAADLPARIRQLTPIQYRSPGSLDDGAVLVVGASASGVQIAEELQRSGRRVTVCVGDHVRLPRTYRGMDIHWWLNALGVLDQRIDEVDDANRARRLPSLQLIGSPEKRTLDVSSLGRLGVEMVGRLVAVGDGRAQCSGSLANLVRSADLKQERLLDQIDEFASAHGLVDEITPPDRPMRTVVGPGANVVDLKPFDTVVWATGFRPHYPWLDQRWLDHRGGIRHDGGVADMPGLYVLGLTFMRRRKSSFIDGVGADAGELTDHVLAHLGRRSAAGLRANR